MTDDLDKSDFKTTQHWGERMRQETLDAGYKANYASVESIKNVLEQMHKDNPQAVSFYLFETDSELKRCAGIRPLSSYGSAGLIYRVFDFLSNQYNREMTCATLGITSMEPGVVPSSPFDIYKDVHVFKVTF